MTYVKFKEIPRQFDFSKAIKNEDLPGYIRHYVPEDELILSIYQTSRDHGLFTDRKIVLFDRVSGKENYKQIHTIPYTSISVLSVAFKEKTSELNLYLECGFPIKLNFLNTKPEDKVRLRLLYTCINRIMNNQKPLEEDIKKLRKDDMRVQFKEDIEKRH